MVNLIVNNKNIDNIELVVFDKDGTIIDLYNYWFHMIELRAEKICTFYNLPSKDHKKKLMFEMGVDWQNKRLRPEGPVGLLSRKDVQKAAEDYLSKFDCKDIYNVCFSIFKEVDEISLSFLDSFIKPIPGAIDLLKQIKTNGGKNAIATTDKTARAELAVKFLKIDNLFDYIIGADEVNKAKPAPDMLNIINESLGITSLKSVMVGDAKTDVQMRINAGYKASIGLCSGLTDRDTLIKITPYVVEDISKISIG